ncbi:MAG: winged helix-turn-helix domain-containing protein [Armatimonas sp.]
MKSTGPVWHATFLGAFGLERAGERREKLRSLKMAVLLARLAGTPGRLFSRDELIADLWPDDTIESGQNSLRVALSRLKSEVGEGVIEATRLHIRLIPGTLDTDVAAFEAAVKRGDWANALALHKGPYLPGAYDDATVLERERLEELAGRMRERAASIGSELPRPALPEYLTRYLPPAGLEDELAALIRARRLTTILGPGGIGKTRLATELARRLTDEFALVALVPLDECFEAARIPERLRAVLSLTLHEGSTREVLATFFQNRSALLVLDNVEQLLVLDNMEQLVATGAAEVIEDLLQAIPTLRLLVTSRQALGVPGEQVFPLLTLPSEESEALFIDRARYARPGFTPDSRSLNAIRTLCARLDGIPLALELAASRMRSQSVTEILEQLERGDRPLMQPGKLARHASLEAAIAWSWRLLPVHQQRFLAQLSVFRGGWTVEAAAFVGDCPDAADRLEAFLDASLIVREETISGRTRFRLLETIRAFAAQQLDPGLREQARVRHRDYFSRSASREDTENILAALASAREDDDAATAYSLLVTHGQGYLSLLGASVGLAECRATLALPAPTPKERLIVLSLAVQFADTLGDLVLARLLTSEAFEMAGADPTLRAIALSIQGQLAVSCYLSPDEMIPPLREALELTVAIGDDTTRATVLRRLGILLLRSRQFDEAHACFAQSEELFTAIGDLTGARYAMANRAHVRFEQGSLEGALALYRVCLERAREEGDWVHESKILLNIGSIEAALKHWSEARTTTQECIQLCQRIGNMRTLSFALWNLPEPMMHLGHPDKAASLLRYAERLWLTRFGALAPDDITYRDDILATSTIPASDAPKTLDEALSLALSVA